MRSLYTWEGDGGDELPLTEGATYELSAGPNGGENYADGWWEGYDPASGRKGIFPSNYVSLLPFLMMFDALFLCVFVFLCFFWLVEGGEKGGEGTACGRPLGLEFRIYIEIVM